MLKLIPSGTNIIIEKTVKGLESGVQGEHTSNLDGLLAKELADIIGRESHIGDPGF